MNQHLQKSLHTPGESEPISEPTPPLIPAPVHEPVPEPIAEPISDPKTDPIIAQAKRVFSLGSKNRTTGG